MIKSILTNYYVYSMDGRSSSPCDLYLFQVTAVNDAGEGYPSDVIVRNLPSLPDVSRVSRSVRHSLTKTPLGVALSLGFYVSGIKLPLVISWGKETTFISEGLIHVCVLWGLRNYFLIV